MKDIVAAGKTDAGNPEAKREFSLLLEAFRVFIDIRENSAERWDVMEDIISLRASFLVNRVLTGLRMDFDKALEILRNFNQDLSEFEKQQREILVAAIDNLVDFAAAEENRMLEELPEGWEEDWEDSQEDYQEDNLDDDDRGECEDVFEKYNYTFAERENDVVLYAAQVAGWWLPIPAETIITFMTQGDERVRDWHLSHDGISYPKREFPAELLPPIEWGCRCFLVSEGSGAIMGAVNFERFKGKCDPVFKESLAKGGRIFSEEHPYFRVTIRKEIAEIAARIKAKFYLK